MLGCARTLTKETKYRRKKKETANRPISRSLCFMCSSALEQMKKKNGMK